MICHLTKTIVANRSLGETNDGESLTAHFELPDTDTIELATQNSNNIITNKTDVNWRALWHECKWRTEKSSVRFTGLRHMDWKTLRVLFVLMLH